MTDQNKPPGDVAGQEAPAPAEKTSTEKSEAAREIGGREGPDPTRFGDWEKNGRCIDF